MFQKTVQETQRHSNCFASEPHITVSQIGSVSSDFSAYRVSLKKQPFTPHACVCVAHRCHKGPFTDLKRSLNKLLQLLLLQSTLKHSGVKQQAKLLFAQKSATRAGLSEEPWLGSSSLLGISPVCQFKVSSRLPRPMSQEREPRESCIAFYGLAIFY